MDFKKMMKRKLTEEEAVTLAESKWWEGISLSEAANLQLRQDKLCMPFDKFQEGTGKLLGRPVWTHEFAKPDALIAEIEGKCVAPNSPLESLEKIIGKDKMDNVIVVKIP